MSFCARDECNLQGESRSCTPDSPCRLPWHYRVHREGFHLESFCGVCNLFPGVLVIATCQLLGGTALLIYLLQYGQYYDKIHQSDAMTLLSGAMLSAVIGAGALLYVVAFSETVRTMMVYLFVSCILNLGMFTLSVYKIISACRRMAPSTLVPMSHTATDYIEINLACTWSIFSFGLSLLHLFGAVVVFSFYHFRYVRRVIYMHEASCMCK